MKKIWMYWDKGYDRSPDLVKHCIHSWKKHNKDWEFTLLDDTSYSSYADVRAYKRNPIKVQAFSDILRIKLLSNHGGVWADATCFCTKPLDEWLFDSQQDGFFIFKNPAQGRPICNWFIYSDSRNEIAEICERLVEEYWDGRTGQYPYFWFHQQFKLLLQNNASVRHLYQSLDSDARANCFRYDNPHYFAPYNSNFLSSIDDEYRANIGLSPIYKLNKSINCNAAKINHLISKFS